MVRPTPAGNRNLCDSGLVPDDPRKEFAAPQAGKRDVPTMPFPRMAYVFGWLAICLVTAEGINSFMSGLLGTGIILLCLIPVMVWFMHVRPHRHGARQRRR
jgi:hypothetical protein